MTSNSNYPPNLWKWLKPGSANLTFLAGLLLLILLIAAVIYWSQHTPEPRVPLLSGAKLHEHDLGRMQLAFGKAALNDFEIRDGQVFVPQSKRDRFLKALDDHDGVPETTREMYESESVNPWATSQQVSAATLLRKKKLIRQLVLQLEFVADAIVDYDELVEGGWPPTTRRSAAIVVRPKGDRLLETYQVDAIRNTICGAVAGLTPADIVITDISAGHAYVGPTAEQDPSVALQWLEHAKLEQRIRDQLAQFGNGIEVHVAPDRSGGSIEHATSTADQHSHVAPADAPVANQPAALESNTASPPSSEPVESNAGPREDPQSIIVRIRIPESCVLDFAQVSAAESQGAQTFDQRFRQLQKQIIAVVEPLVSAGGFRTRQTDVDVSMIRRPATPDESSSQSSLTRFVVPSNTLVIGAAILVGAGILIFLFGWRQMARRERRSDDRVNLATHSGRHASAVRPVADSISDETRRKLTQMVDDDPDQAAEIIKQWIRGAA